MGSALLQSTTLVLTIQQLPKKRPITPLTPISRVRVKRRHLTLLKTLTRSQICLVKNPPPIFKWLKTARTVLQLKELQLSQYLLQSKGRWTSSPQRNTALSWQAPLAARPRLLDQPPSTRTKTLFKSVSLNLLLLLRPSPPQLRKSYSSS